MTTRRRYPCLTTPRKEENMEAKMPFDVPEIYTGL
jgi:hypothetical protein